MLSETVLALSHWQSTLTSLLHLVFIPLSLGLSLLLAGLEIRLSISGDIRLKPVIQFWARLLAVQLALAMSTRLLLLLQFGVNTSFFARFAGDNFALPLAIEACSSFFLLSVLFGPFWFGWSRLSDKQHALISTLLCLTLHLSILWLISAYAWLEHPNGGTFNPQSLRIETHDGWQLLHPDGLGGQVLHQLGLSYAIAAGLIISICGWLALRQPQHPIIRASQRYAALGGILAIAALAMHGHDSATTLTQQIRQNTLRGIDNRPLVTEIQNHIRNGLSGFIALKAWREDEKNAPLADSFNQQKTDLGYALLLKRWLGKIENANDKQIKLAAETVLPSQPELIFWIHKGLMVAGLISLIIFALALLPKPPLLKPLLLALPVNGILVLTDVLLNHIQHQPWLVDGVLPEFVAYSTLTLPELAAGCIFYTVSAAVSIVISIMLSMHIIRSTRVSGDA